MVSTKARICNFIGSHGKPLNVEFRRGVTFYQQGGDIKPVACNGGLDMITKETLKATMDSLALGTGIIKTGVRKWWNPMRWIKGPIYQKRIHPRKFHA